MLNKLNTRYILQLVATIVGLFIVTFTLSNVTIINTIDDSIEERITEYMGKSYNSDNIKFLYITQEDIDSINSDGIEFNAYLTNLINNNLSRSKSIVLDFVLEESSNPTIDAELATALNSTQASVIAYEDESISQDHAVPPQIFYKNSAYQGFRNFRKNSMGYVDKYYPLSPSNSNAVSLIVAVAQANGAQVSKNTKHNMLSVVTPTSSEILRLNKDMSFKRLPVTFPSRNVYPIKNVLRGDYQSYVFDDSIVFIGFEDDKVQTPYGEITHAEYTANGYLSLINNYTYRIAPSILTFIFGVFLLLFLFASESSSRWWIRIVLFVLIVISAFTANLLFAKYLHIYFDLTVILIYLTLMALLTSFSSLFTVREELVRESSVIH